LKETSLSLGYGQERTTMSINRPPETTLLYTLIDLETRRKESLKQLENVSLTEAEKAFWQDHLRLVQNAQASFDCDMQSDPLGMALWFFADGHYDQCSELLRRVKGDFPQ